MMTFVIADLCSTDYTFLRFFEEIAHIFYFKYLQQLNKFVLYSGRMICLFFYMSTLPFLCGKDDIFLYFDSGNDASDHT